VGFEFEPRSAKSKSRAAKTGQTPGQAEKPSQIKVDFTGQQPLGSCPICASQVFQTQAAYVCEKSQAGTGACKFKINKLILQQEVDPTQAAKLLAERRTDLLPKFVSSKSGRPFAAFLVMDDYGKVTFDFPPREGENLKGN
jgi:DNA topoisomerase III